MVRLRGSADVRDAIPVALMLATWIVAHLWNIRAGVVWNAPLIVALMVPSFLLPVSLLFLFVRPQRQIAEVTLYVMLWTSYGIIGDQLSYVGATLANPLRDLEFVRFDAAFGLDWQTLSHFGDGTPWLGRVLEVAYGSYYLQPLFSAAVFAACRPGRNCELLTAMMIAVTVSIVVAAVFPAQGPGHLPGVQGPWPWEPAFMELRAGAHAPMPYNVGIITFPSVHAVLAVLVTIAHRDVKWTFLPVASLNLLMLLGTPRYGDHYFADIVAGALIAALSYLVARKLVEAVVGLRLASIPAAA